MPTQIQQQFTEISTNSKFDCVILGNSRCYRGINPELFPVNTYNFAFDNDSFLECYYKLLWLENEKKLPSTIIMGVDYFEFSFISAGMKGVYSQYFCNEYVDILNTAKNVTFSEKRGIDTKINALMNNIFTGNYAKGTKYLIMKLCNKEWKDSALVKGQYRIYPQPKSSLGDFLIRSHEITNEQMNAYNSIIKLCNEKNIALIQVMPPLRYIEYNCYSEVIMKDFDHLFEENGYYLNYCLYDTNISHYMDDSHLNLIGADIFTNRLVNDIF